MSHPDPPNELVAGVRPARFALIAFALLWVALVAWVLRNDERLLVDASSRTPPARVAAGAALPADAPEPSSIAAARESVAAIEASERAPGDAVDAPPSDGSGSGERASGPGAAETAGTDSVEADGTGPDAPATGGGSDGAEVAGDADVIVPGTSGGGPDAESADGDGPDDAIGDDGGAVGREASGEATAPLGGADTGADGADDAVDAGRAGTPTGEPTFVPDEGPARAETDGGGAVVSVEPFPPATGPGIEPIDASAVPPRRVESAFEARRREELETLESLLADVAFEPLDGALADGAREPLERAFEILFLYPRTRVDLVVESRETNDAAADRRLAEDRAARVVDYLVSRGIERARLTARAGDGGGLPFGEHRVRVKVEDEDQER